MVGKRIRGSFGPPHSLKVFLPALSGIKRHLVFPSIDPEKEGQIFQHEISTN